MNTLTSSIALFSAAAPLAIIIILFLFFIINHNKYKELLSMYYKEGFTLTSLYQFYNSMGLLGSFGMAYYFSRLKKDKKVIFPPENKDAITAYLNKINPAYTTWLNTYYLVFLMALYLYSIFIILSILKIILAKTLM